MLGCVLRDIHSRFLHHLDGSRIDTGRDHTRAVDLDSTAGQVSDPAFGHLRSAGVARAEHEDPWNTYTRLFFMHTALVAHTWVNSADASNPALVIADRSVRMNPFF